MDVFAAVDVYYAKDSATAALVEFPDISSDSITGALRKDLRIAAPYFPGKFYLRELPCILKILEMTNKLYKGIFIDGFVFLKEPLNLGLGGYLARALSYQTTVIGVAKSFFHQADKYVEIKRGRSSRPLYVSAYNMEAHLAGSWVKNMYGSNRIPYILKITDQLSRNLINDKML